MESVGISVINGGYKIKREEQRVMFFFDNIHLIGWASTVNLFLFGTSIFFVSASDLLLRFDFLNCNYALLMRVLCAQMWVRGAQNTPTFGLN